jgi:hypothetical protein
MAIYRPKQLWRLALGLSGIFLLIGGPMHPDPDLNLDFDHSTAHMLRDPGWIPAHSFMLASFVCLLVGLMGLYRSGTVSGRLANITRVGIVGALLAVAEMSFHLMAFVDADALANGGSAKIAHTHLTLAIFAYPIAGGSIALLAWFGGRSRLFTHPLLGIVGTLGGIIHGIAGPLVVLTKDQHYSFLFKGAILFGIWLIAVGVGYFYPRISQDEPASAGLTSEQSQSNG